MDWIEKIFGLSPDGGDGSTEAMIVAICGLLFLAAVFAFSARARDYVKALAGIRTPRS